MSKLEELIARLCPDGVEYKKIKDISLKISDGMHNLPKGVTSEGIYPILSAQNINYSKITLDTKKWVNDKIFAVENKRTDLGKGDVLLTIVGAIGRVAVVKTDLKALFQRSVCVIKPKANIILSDFLMYVLYSSRINKLMQDNAHGAAQKGIYLKQVAEIKIPVPPLEVQREIVHVLDSFTFLTAELAAELAARQKQYAHYKEFLFESLQDIESTTLDKISINRDSQRKPVTSSKREAGEIPYYGASGIVDYVKDYIFDGDYLLVSEDGANLLARSTPIAFSISGKTWVNNHAHILEFPNYHTRKFVEYYLNSIDLSPFISGGAQPKLNQKNLNKIDIPVPPLSEQQRIVDILDRFDALCSDITSGLPAEIEARKKQYEYYRDKLLTFKELKKEA